MRFLANEINVTLRSVCAIDCRAIPVPRQSALPNLRVTVLRFLDTLRSSVSSLLVIFGHPILQRIGAVIDKCTIDLGASHGELPLSHWDTSNIAKATF